MIELSVLETFSDTFLRNTDSEVELDDKDLTQNTSRMGVALLTNNVRNIDSTHMSLGTKMDMAKVSTGMHFPSTHFFPRLRKITPRLGGQKPKTSRHFLDMQKFIFVELTLKELSLIFVRCESQLTSYSALQKHYSWNLDYSHPQRKFTLYWPVA